MHDIPKIYQFLGEEYAQRRAAEEVFEKLNQSLVRAHDILKALKLGKIKLEQLEVDDKGFVVNEPK